MYGAIKQAGYNEQFAIGTIATSGTLGILIPPSIVFIVYGLQLINLLVNFSWLDLFLVYDWCYDDDCNYFLAKKSGFKGGQRAF